MATTTQPQKKPEVESLGKKVIAALQRRGPMSFIQLQKTFILADKDKSGHLSKEEFITACRKMGVVMQEKELQTLAEFDPNHDGSVSYEEFLRAIRPPMNDVRIAVVKKAFAKLDKDGSGVVTVDDLRRIYSAKAHSDVQTGKRNEDEVLKEFLGNFEATKKDGKVDFEEFKEYYENLSVCIDDDRHFSLMIFQAWRL